MDAGVEIGRYMSDVTRTYVVGTPSAFQRDLTLIRIITENDFGPRHAEAIAVLDGVTWYR